MPSDDRGPAPSTIERVISAWQRARAGLAADDMLISDETAVTLGPDIENIEADVDTVLRRIVRAMLYASLREAEAGELQKALHARKLRYETRGEMLRRELLDILTVLRRDRFVAPEGTISLRALGQSVVILDAEAVPDEYVTIHTSRVPDKRKIYADLVEGVVIDGCALSNGGLGLTFRRPRGAGDAVKVEE